MTGPDRRPLVLGAVLVGVGAQGSGDLWRHPEVPTTASVDIGWYIRQAREAEAAHFDFVFIVDSQYIDAGFPNHHLNRLEPLTLLSAVAVATERIGLVATVSTTYSEPWDIARRVASLDLISDGRAAWNIVTSQDPGTAGNFSRSAHGDYSTRYRRAAESVEVVRGLWDSYEDDAFATDKDAERFLDPKRLHRLDHVGEFFSVTGPLNIRRSRQGQPVLVQAGTSPDGRELSARVGEIVFSFAKTVTEASELRADVESRARAHGRDVDDIVFVPGLNVVIRDTEEQAREAHRRQLETVPAESLLPALKRLFGGLEVDGHDLDAPFPALDPEREGALAGARIVLEHARAERLTLRETLRTLQTHWAHVVGSPATVADEIERWYRSGAADGFNLFVHDPEDWARFRSDVVPLLVERGLFRADYAGATLRDHLRLPVPENRHTAARRASLAESLVR
ncbi:NtaA/DmoA family FMN-dependent monooxygenase [Microbacterium sp. 18062]|uniref:NtaA/DmoA family FMN-dependent monooxygenase n=1 Tax=Microbacterium sp. 18062 TaxID=2681410 RepID=UPI00135AFA0F|nr:NtaA/DmoA family FMN-dependent monooxygenase [Microbacterium sp. 18062]